MTNIKHFKNSVAFVLLALTLPITGFAACLDTLEAEAPTTRFTITNGTVTDTYTGLIWLRCALGQQWSTEQNTCAASPNNANTFTWSDALQTANTITAEGFDDWRLPNKNELGSLVDRACTGPAINGEVFPGTFNGGYWTSTPWRVEARKAWHIDFTTGTLIAREAEALFRVYLVREQ